MQTMTLLIVPKTSKNVSLEFSCAAVAGKCSLKTLLTSDLCHFSPSKR